MEEKSVSAFPSDLKKALDQEAKREQIKRSTLIQKAVRVYLNLKKQEDTRNLLRYGYQEMYSVSKKMTDEFSTLDKDSAKYVD